MADDAGTVNMDFFYNNKKMELQELDLCMKKVYATTQKISAAIQGNDLFAIRVHRNLPSP